MSVPPRWLRDCGLSDNEILRLEKGELLNPSEKSWCFQINEKFKRALISGIKQLFYDVSRGLIIIVIVMKILVFMDRNIARF